MDSLICHGEFVLINHVVKEYNKMKEKIKKSNSIRPSDLARVAMVFNSTRKFIEEFRIFIKQQYYDIVSSVEKIQKLKIQKLQGQKMEE